ncbi:MAG: TlpA disulfide reductase family protein [Planctomycetota bacterium]
MSTAMLTSAAGIAAQDAGTAEAAAAKKPEKRLGIGAPAPALSIGEWVKGDPVDGFESDHVYVVEFWATWCGPCIAGMPHLTDLQAEYGDKVTILGVNIWDDPEKVQPFMENPVAMHDKPGDEVMGYTVAIEEKHDEGNVRNGKMAAAWMDAAGRSGIPTAFIVDQQQRIAWIGHPMSMDKPLAKVVAGEWDIQQAAADHAAQLAAAAEISRYFELFEASKFDAAYQLGHKLVAGPMANSAGRLNTVAWMIVDPDATPAKQDLKLALAAAKRASELTDDEDPAILDTLAKVHFDMGNTAEAVKTQSLAAKFAPGTQFEKEVAERLAEYKKAAEKADQ